MKLPFLGGARRALANLLDSCPRVNLSCRVDVSKKIELLITQTL